MRSAVVDITGYYDVTAVAGVSFDWQPAQKGSQPGHSDQSLTGLSSWSTFSNIRPVAMWLIQNRDNTVGFTSKC